MKKSVLLLMMIWCMVFSIHAQVTITLVTDESTLDESKVYMLGSAINSKKVYSLRSFIDRKNTNGIYFQTYTTETNNTSTSSISGENFILFRFIKQGDYYLLYDAKNEYYIGLPHNPSQGTYWGTHESPTEINRFYFSDHRLMINGMYVCLTSNTYLSRLSTLETNYIRIYEISNVGSLTIGDSDGYTGNVVSNVKDVTINRTFVNSIYNTVMLPFDVKNYKEVFGNDTEVYQLSTAEDADISFSLMADDATMYANRPYLIRSTSFDGTAHNYVFNNAVFHIPTTKTASYSTSEFDFIGSYKTDENAGGKNAYILYNNEFLYCGDNTTNLVKPTRWYIVDKRASGAKPTLTIRIDDDEPTGIQTHKNPSQPAKYYSLQGTCMGVAPDLLPKGIYLYQGRKIIKR